MKKLLFGIMVAIIAMTFSAFTTMHKSKFVDTYYYLGTDGKYYKYIGFYDVGNCIPTSSGSCIYRWYTGGDPGLPNPLTATQFNTFFNGGYFIATGPTNFRYDPS